MIEQTQKNRYSLLIYLALVAAIVVAYEPMRRDTFISYDDPLYVTQNPHITGGLTVKSVIWAFTQPHYHMYHPLTSLSHMLDCELFRLNPFWHHAVSLLFHTLNALLLFSVLKRMTGALWPSAFVAAVFALHPLQVESVAWVSERKSVLSGFFSILTLAAYVRYCERPAIGRYLLVIAAYICALMSKPVVVALPLALLLLDYWPLRRLRTKSAENDQVQPPQYRQFSAKWLIAEKIPLLFLSTALVVITFIVQRFFVSTLGLVPLKYRIANAFLAYIEYIEKFFWPRKLAVFYPHLANRTPMVTAAVCAVALVLITVQIIRLANRRRYLPVGWFWFIGMLVPVIGIVQAGAQSMADRYMYLPIIGLLIIVAWVVNDFMPTLRYRKALMTVAAAAVLSAAVLCTRNQLGYWKNNSTIFQHALEVTSNNAVMHNNYAIVLHNEGRLDEALPHLQKAVEILPTFSKARFNLSMLYLELGKLDEAAASFNKYLTLDKNSPESYYYLGLISVKKRQFDQAVVYFTQALRINPNHIKARYELGKVYLLTGWVDKAVECFKDVLRINPKQADVYTSLGAAYLKKNRPDLAAKSWTAAVELAPDSVGVLNNLAWVLAATKDDSVRNPDKAVQFARRACELTSYNFPDALDTLAVSFAAEGKFDQAVQTADRALKLAEEQGKEKLAEQIRARLDLYHANKPYYDN